MTRSETAKREAEASGFPLSTLTFGLSLRAAKLKMGGVVGEAVYEGDLVSLLSLGMAFHFALSTFSYAVGKGTGMGLGRYEMDSCKFLAHIAAGESAGADP